MSSILIPLWEQRQDEGLNKNDYTPQAPGDTQLEVDGPRARWCSPACSRPMTN